MANESYSYTSKKDLAQSQDVPDTSSTKAPPKTYAPMSEPKLVGMDRLYARDNSGGPDWSSDTANFGDGGVKQGRKIGA